MKKVNSIQFSRFVDYNNSYNTSSVTTSSNDKLIDVIMDDNMYCSAIFLKDEYDTSEEQVTYFFYIVPENTTFYDDPKENNMSLSLVDITPTTFLKSVSRMEDRYLEDYYIFYKRTITKKEIRNEKIVSLLNEE